MTTSPRVFVHRLLLPLGLVLGLGVAHAANLGGVRVLSQAGEPLRAEIGLTGVAEADAGNVRAALASPDIFAASGLSYPAVLDSVRINVVRSGDGYVLRMTSTQPVTEALLTPVIELSVNGASQLKSVSLSIPGGRSSAPSAPAAGSSEVPPWPVPVPAKPAATPAAAPQAQQAPAAPKPAPAPAPAAAQPTPAMVKAAVAEVIKQELKDSVSAEETRRQLDETKVRLEKMALALATMEQLVATQQKIIDAQAGVQPVPSLVEMSEAEGKPAGANPDAPLAVTGEREGLDPKAIVIGASGAVLGLCVFFLLASFWQRRIRLRRLRLPAPVQ